MHSMDESLKKYVLFKLNTDLSSWDLITDTHKYMLYEYDFIWLTVDLFYACTTD